MSLVRTALIALFLVAFLQNAAGQKRPQSIVKPRGAVATDDGRCSEIGMSVLQQGGNAIDASVAAALCLGVVSPASSGIGGGAFTVVKIAGGEAIAYDSRETAPLRATENMYGSNPDLKKKGILSAGVPGELAGLYTAWKQHGKLPWKQLVTPAEKLAEGGFRISKYLYMQLNATRADVLADKGLSELYVSNGQFKKPGTIIHNRKLAFTLKQIAENGPKAFYNGTVGVSLASDISKAGGIITLKDLQSYRVKVRKPLSANILGYELLGMPPPSSGGAAMMLVLNILSQYGIPSGVSGSLGVHRLIEALKHAFAVRMNLADPDFVDVTKVVSDMLSPEFAKDLKTKINDDKTFDPKYYGGMWNQINHHGTCHFSIIDSERNAVSMTTTVNGYFGAVMLSPSTGIVLNNQMDDFTIPSKSSGDLNVPPPAPASFIRPGKRPLSSMSPTIVLKDGKVKAVVGASGGANIIAATTEVFLNHFFLNMDPLSSVLAPRIYHQLIPNKISFENLTTVFGDHFEIPKETRVVLEKKGHVLTPMTGATIVQFIVQESDGNAGGMNLLQSEEVEAIIIGGDSILETKLLAEIGEKARVPVISVNPPISSSWSRYSHLIQAAHDFASEAKGITAFIHEFDWKSVGLIYEDDDDWRESMQIMVDHFYENGVGVESKVGFAMTSSEEMVMDRLRKMKDLGTSVFVVHSSEVTATRLFPCAERLGMMGEGFAWILTAKSMSSSFHGKEAMEGVVGFKTYIPMSRELQNFTLRLRTSLGNGDGFRLSVSGVWAHDVAWALARSAEMVNASSTLLEAITECRFKGLSGDFQVKDKMFLSDKFEIVNLLESGERRIGFWNGNGSFSSRRHFNKLEAIIWPGGSAQTPGGRVLGESKRRKLRVLVTSSNRFPRLMKVETDSATNVTTAEGFCIEVFRAATEPFNYDLEFIPWRNGSNYDNLAIALSTQKDKYDAAVGDITITANRSKYVDFTMPFTEMGLGTVAPKETNMWVFFHPLTRDLWITSAAFFVLTGFIVWLIERPKNKDFQGSWSKQIGIIFWFGFSTLVYAHREKLQHNLSRFVVTVWVFAVLILTASYTATLTSMMTVQQIRFNSNEDSVGHLSGSLIAKMALTSPRFRPTNTKGLNTSIEYAQAMLNNTVSFIVDELPYLKVLLVEHPGKFLMVKAQCNTNGLGFMFQKGHELVPLVSREILNLIRTSDKLIDMEKRWFENQLPYTADDTLNPITLFRFRGLFMITGVSFAFALLVLLILWLRDTWEDLMSSVNIFLSQRLVHFRILFARTIHPNPLPDAAIGDNAVQMAQRNNR
ncbi:hypothetical protein Bca4012_040993 [Brassica carinata]